VYSAFGAIVETMCEPGATTSGFANPSWVVPRLDQLSSASSSVFFVPMSSTAPTVITNGSFPGAYERASELAPSLPDAVTTTMPLFHAASTAASSGSVR
jgi:hypothetical protein